jgi:hypothetical protein
VKHCRLLGIIGITASALVLGSVSNAQSRGELTVTAIVVASVGVEAGPDGNLHVIVANVPDPRDNVSRLVSASAAKPKKSAKKADHHK